MPGNRGYVSFGIKPFPAGGNETTPHTATRFGFGFPIEDLTQAPLHPTKDYIRFRNTSPPYFPPPRRCGPLLPWTFRRTGPSVPPLKPIALLLALAAPMHAGFLVSPGEFPGLRARAASAPWSEMKAAAIDHALTQPATVSGAADDWHYQIRRMSNCATLALILDPDNEASYLPQLVTSLKEWQDVLTVAQTAWATTTPPATSAVTSIIALDLFGEKMSPADRAEIEGHLAAFVAKVGTTGSWPNARRGLAFTWNLYLRNLSEAGNLLDTHVNYARGQMSPDGFFLNASSYAMARMLLADRGASKNLPFDLSHLVGFSNRYEDARLVKFYEHLWQAQVGSHQAGTTFGDSLAGPPRNYGGLLSTPTPETDPGNFWQVVSARRSSLQRFSLTAAENAAWHARNGPRWHINDILLTYLLHDRFPATPRKPLSRIYPDGGASFWGAGNGGNGLFGALKNASTATVDSFHTHRDANGLHLAAYGEDLIRGSGWFQGDTDAEAGNTLTFNGANHATYRGGGISEGFTSERFDYARGESGPATGSDHHQRHFLQIDTQDGRPGYFAVFDRTTQASSGSVETRFHPYADNMSEGHSPGRFTQAPSTASAPRPTSPSTSFSPRLPTPSRSRTAHSTPTAASSNPENTCDPSTTFPVAEKRAR